MPEGDTIRRLADRIELRLAGRTVIRSVFRHPRLATVDLVGRTLVGARSQGKHLFIRFDDDTSLHVHLLMQGRVRFTRDPGGDPRRRRFEIEFAPDPELENDGRPPIVIGVDIPLLHLVPTSAEHTFTDHLGPDVCGAFDVQVGIDRLSAAGDQPLGGALLDQRRIAGYGNIYAVEVPFIVGIAPTTPVAEIDDVAPIVHVATALIRANAEAGPQNTTGRRLHTDDHWVIDGSIRSCKLCGTSLVRRRGEQTPWRRRTAWCPRCQPTDAVRPDEARARELLALHPARRLLDPTSLELVVPTDRPVVPRRPLRTGPSRARTPGRRSR